MNFFLPLLENGIVQGAVAMLYPAGGGSFGQNAELMISCLMTSFFCGKLIIADNLQTYFFSPRRIFKNEFLGGRQETELTCTNKGILYRFSMTFDITIKKKEQQNGSARD